MRNSARRILAGSVLVTAVLYVVPFGRTIAWPLVLISTLAHELGHGLTAALLGGHFQALRINADASGAALWSGAFGRVAVATVAAAGLIGPAVAAFVLFAVGRDPRRARMALVVLGVGLYLIALLVVRNPFGLSFTVILGSVLLLVAVRFPRASQTVVILLAVQLALSVFSRGDYLFMRTARTAGGPMPSDVSVMADALFLPYWFWGALCGILSVAILWAGVKMFFRGRSGCSRTLQSSLTSQASWRPALAGPNSWCPALAGLSSRRRPNDALFLRHRPNSLVDELLQPSSFVGLGREDVPLRVGCDAVDGEE